ncbi:AAA family ATPase [Lachnospiraceae bacterium LCP25S3_G4]
MEYRSKEAEIANRLYDLDDRVYRSLESTLGRVYTDERHICVEQIIQNIKKRKIHRIRSEMALIANMAHTVDKEEDCIELMSEYAKIKQLIDELPKDYCSVEILNSKAADLYGIDITGKFSPDRNRIICIGRQFGSAGTEIGFELANRLNIEFYDKEIFETVLRRMEISNEAVDDYNVYPPNRKKKRPSFFRDISRYHGLPREDALFFNQGDLISNMAKQKSFVIMGRCADVILTHHKIPHFSIFIDAPFELRVHRTMEMKKLTYKEAIKYVKQMDKSHKKYYNFYTGKIWGDAANYDLCINSSTYGIVGSVNIIERMLTKVDVQK